jgi:diaminopimelate decarboxylase
MAAPGTGFRFHEKQLCCERVPLARVAEAVGTPVYVYSEEAIRENYRRLQRVFRGVPHRICYSVKANSNLTVLRELRRLGAGFDIVSAGELRRVLGAGALPGRVVYSGVGKTPEELDLALRTGVLAFSVESGAELELLAERARRGRTGRHADKFGVPWRAVALLCQRAASLPEIDFMGLACHIGSQITRLAPFEQALGRLEAVSAELARNGLTVRVLDFGGGVGIRYHRERPIAWSAYASRVKRLVRRLGCRLLLEPGRAIVGPAGLLLTRVILEKDTPSRRFVVVDAGMNDLLRPALYGASHRIQPVNATSGRRQGRRCDVVGPLCETADALGRDVRLPRLQPGALLAVRDTGAYGFVLSSNYNARRRPAEVMVRGRRFEVIRKRETWRDLVRGEV